MLTAVNVVALQFLLNIFDKITDHKIPNTFIP